MHSFRKLEIWKKSRLLVKDVYITSMSFPTEEKFGITSQLRRAVVSISNNIAEGAGRNSRKEFLNFLNYSYASSFEVENLLILSTDLGYMNERELDSYSKRIEEFQKMTFSLINKLKNDQVAEPEAEYQSQYSVLGTKNL